MFIGMPILLEGEGRTPTWGDIDALSSKIQYQIYIQGPEILAAIVQRCRKEREEQIKFRNDSELLRLGQPDILGKIHKSSGSRYGRGLFQEIIVAEVRHECPKKSSWKKRRQQLADKAQEYLINQALSDAEK